MSGVEIAAASKAIQRNSTEPVPCNVALTDAVLEVTVPKAVSENFSFVVTEIELDTVVESTTQ